MLHSIVIQYFSAFLQDTSGRTRKIKILRHSIFFEKPVKGVNVTERESDNVRCVAFFCHITCLVGAPQANQVIGGIIDNDTGHPPRGILSSSSCGRKRTDPDASSLLRSPSDYQNMTTTNDPRQLFAAVKQGDLSRVNSLMESETINVNAQFKAGWTALHMACKTNELGIVQTLVQNGANVHAQTRKEKPHCIGPIRMAT